MDRPERRRAPRLTATIYTLCHEAHGQRIQVVDDVSVTGFSYVDRVSTKRVGDSTTLEFPTGIMVTGTIAHITGDRVGVRITRVDGPRYHALLDRLFKERTPPFGYKTLAD